MKGRLTPDDTTHDGWLSLHRAGWSYRRIARESGARTTAVFKGVQLAREREGLRSPASPVARPPRLVMVYGCSSKALKLLGCRDIHPCVVCRGWGVFEREHSCPLCSGAGQVQDGRCGACGGDGVIWPGPCPACCGSGVGLMPEGSRCCCGAEHCTGIEDHPALRLDPKRDPKPEPVAVVGGSKPAGTRRQKRARAKSA